MYRQLDYQDRVLTTLDGYLDTLKAEKARADRIAAVAAESPDLGIDLPDFTEKAWDVLKAKGALPLARAAIPFSSRRDGCAKPGEPGRPVPNVVLKVPTGGGKTWLACGAVSRILGRYLDTNTGFILWIVPNEAIYAQTIKHLTDRQHPYRQALDRAAAGRVRIMEKGDPLDARDVGANLCVMLLMLQSANRQTKETLKIFRDRGDVHGFTPDGGDQAAHATLREQIPNLDIYDLADGDAQWPTIKDSLGNALRIIRPVVVLDEAHRAISELAYDTIYGFNPCFVLDLTATPQDVPARNGANPRDARHANVLVEVTGLELDREGMIKMPLNLDTRQGIDWKATLNTALTTLDRLDAEAKKLRADTGRYIRPIMLVQVERTGADQRDGAHIHAEDVKDWLLTAGFDEAEIAIKTAEQNDLRQPENQNLLSPTNRVRVIVTKQALQEGWDCPFAYVLCALAASSNLKAMTQLVGRILRQPGAEKTEIPALDECHVITHHAQTATVVQAVKKGLEADGLGDLFVNVAGDAVAGAKLARSVHRRSDFTSTQIYLPKVMILEGGAARELDYETDVLSAIDWRGYDPADIAGRLPDDAQTVESQLQRLRLAEDGDQRIVGETVAAYREARSFDPAHAVRMVSDIVPNAFVGREIVGRLLTALRDRGFDDAKLGDMAGLIVDELRKGLDAERTARAEVLFKAEVEAGRIQFRLRMDGQNWLMPDIIETTEPLGADQLLSNAGGPLERSLFAPVYRNELNNAERDVAVYLDGHKAVIWWHRNVARRQYGLQGWKRGRVYPDFVFAARGEGDARQITVLETKGDHLDQNLDTTYKRDLLAFLSDRFAWDTAVPAGELELIQNTGETVRCELVLMSDWPAEQSKLIS